MVPLKKTEEIANIGDGSPFAGAPWVANVRKTKRSRALAYELLDGHGATLAISPIGARWEDYLLLAAAPALYAFAKSMEAIATTATRDLRDATTPKERTDLISAVLNAWDEEGKPAVCLAGFSHVPDYTPGPWEAGVHSCYGDGRADDVCERRVSALHGPLIAVCSKNTPKRHVDIMAAAYELFSFAMKIRLLCLNFEPTFPEDSVRDIQSDFFTAVLHEWRKSGAPALSKAEGGV